MTQYTATKIFRNFEEKKAIYDSKGEIRTFKKVRKIPPLPARPDPKENMVLLRNNGYKPVYKMVPSHVVKWEPATKKSRAGVVYNFYKPVLYSVSYKAK